jgi:hypothetical protein
MSVLEANNLTKDYGHGRGVFDVSFIQGALCTYQCAPWRIYGRP